MVIALPSERFKAVANVEAARRIARYNLECHCAAICLPRELDDRREELVADTSASIIGMYGQVVYIQQWHSPKSREAIEAQR